MKLAKNAITIALLILTFVFTMSAQTLRSGKDDRNIAPTVGTGGPVGGPTGLFTVYDAQTLRRGEFTFSAAYSNFDRDPGDVDITEVPLSFQIGLGDHLELFFNVDGYKAFKVNNPLNLSGFYLPNSRINGISPAAIILAPQGPGTATVTGAVFRPAGTQPFVPYPFAGGSSGNFGFTGSLGVPAAPTGPLFGFTTTNASIGIPTGSSGNTAGNFPGLGSVYGGILPGIVLSTQTVAGAVNGANIRPVVYTLAPSYLPDAPLLNRTYGESAFSTFVVGAKFRLNSVKSAWGIALVPFYRFYADKASDASGFNQLQRGASPGGNRGDFGLNIALDARVRKYLNISGNAGYIYNSSIKADTDGGTFTLLDRPDEFQYAVGLDFPVNRYFQPILEYRGTKYVGARTPNAFENDPQDGIAGVRIFPRRWFGVGLAYRYNFNQQDIDSIRDVTFSQSVGENARLLTPNTTATANTFVTTSSSGALSNVFTPSSDPHGFIVQFFAGHRNERGKPDVENLAANVTAVTLDKNQVVLPCAPGQTSETCTADQTVGVRTTAVDPEGDVLTYSYTVSGGRITGQGANVSWDLTGVRPGTYTITSAVDDGCGFCGQTKSTTINVVDCPNCVTPCTCPTISVTEPSTVTQPGAPMTFTANVSGGSGDTNYTYNWTVSAGSITSGQGTPSITVDTTGLAGQNVTATVEVGGLCTTCTQRTASGTGAVATPPGSTLVAEVGNVKPDELKAQLDNFYVQLNNDPTARGVIINSGTDREVAKRESDIRKAIAFRNYDASRVTFVRGSSDPGIRTRMYLVPAGATAPTE